MKLSDRIYRCDCGYVEDRDFNAALNPVSYTHLDRYYVSVLVEIPDVKIANNSNGGIGIDLGLKEMCIRDRYIYGITIGGTYK